MKVLLAILLFAAAIYASPVTFQDPAGVKVEILCCSDVETERAFSPLWLLPLGAIPLVFINHDEQPSGQLLPPPASGVTPEQPSSVPETSTVLLMGIGLLAIGASLKRRTR